MDPCLDVTAGLANAGDDGIYARRFQSQVIFNWTEEAGGLGGRPAVFMLCSGGPALMRLKVFSTKGGKASAVRSSPGGLAVAEWAESQTDLFNASDPFSRKVLSSLSRLAHSRHVEYIFVLCRSTVLSSGRN
jgi:hypothetical protein